MKPEITNRRRLFAKKSGLRVTGSLLAPSGLANTTVFLASPIKSHSYAQVGARASSFSQKWDCTAGLNTIFSDLNFAGIKGLCLMEGQLRHMDSVERLHGLIERYNVPVSGSSYGLGFDIWKADEYRTILEDIKKTFKWI